MKAPFIWRTLASLWLLALAALALWPPPAARAQTGTGWQPRLRYTIKANWSPKKSDTDPQQETIPASGVATGPELRYHKGSSNEYKRDVLCSFTATATVEVVMEWVPPYNTPDPPAPERQRIWVKADSRAWARAQWQDGYYPTPTLSADNGMAGQVTGDAKSRSSSGLRLLPAAVRREQDGVWRARAGSHTLSAKASLPPLASTTSSGGYPGGTAPTSYIWEKVEVLLNLTAQKDTRGMAVNSNVGSTYRREMVNGSPVRMLNVPVWNGTSRGDTRGWVSAWDGWNGVDGLTFSYWLEGNWSPVWDRDKWWTESIMGITGSGEYIDAFYRPPFANSGRNIPGTVDNVTLRVRDQYDNAEANASLEMHFHDVYEDFKEVQSLKFPRSQQEYPNDWSYYNTLTGPTEHTATNTTEDVFTSEYSVELKSEPWIVKILEQKANFKYIHSQKITNSSIDKWVVPSGQRWRLYRAVPKIQRSGTCSLWEVNGYVRETTWFVTESPCIYEYFREILPTGAQ